MNESRVCSRCCDRVMSNENCSCDPKYLKLEAKMNIDTYVEMMRPFSKRILLCSNSNPEQQVVTCHGHDGPMTINNLPVNANSGMLFDKKGNALGFWNPYNGEQKIKVLHKEVIGTGGELGSLILPNMYSVIQSI